VATSRRPPATAFALHGVEGGPLRGVEHRAHVDRRRVENGAEPETRSLPEAVDLGAARREDAVDRRPLRRGQAQPLEGLTRRRRGTVPGSVRTGGRTLEYVHDDYREVFRAWRALYNLAGAG